MPLGYPLDTDEPQIKLRKPAEEPPYSSFADYHEKVRSGEREATAFSQNVAKLREEEQKRRDLSRLQQHEQHLAHLRASGIPVSAADEERLKIIALKK